MKRQSSNGQPPRLGLRIFRRLWLVFSLLTAILLIVVLTASFDHPATARVIAGAGVVLCGLGLAGVWWMAARHAAVQAYNTADLTARLALIQASTQQIMANFNHRNAVHAACETALAISHADQAAVLVLDDGGQHLKLVESAGLPAAYREQLQAVPYSASLFDGSARFITDTTTLPDGDPFGKLLAQQAFRALAQLPLHQDGVLLGYLTLFHSAPHSYTEVEQYLLNILAGQVAVALDNERLLQSLELYAFETSHLEHLSEMLGFSLEPDKLADAAAALLCQMLRLDYAALALLDSHTGQLRPVGKDAPLLPPVSTLAELEETPPPQQFFRGEPHSFNDFMAQHQLASLIFMPLMQNNLLFGLIILGAEQTRRLNEHEQRLLIAAAAQINTQMINAVLHEQTQQALDTRLKQLAQIERIVQQISSSQNFSDIIAHVLSAAATTTQADTAALALLTEADDLWVIQHEYEGDQIHKFYIEQAKDAGVIGQVVQQGKMLLVNDNRQLPYYLPSPTRAYLSSLVVPLVRDSEIIGALDVESSQANFFTAEQGVFLKSLAAHATISIQNARLLEELHYQVDMLINLRELSLDLSSVGETSAVADAVLEAALRILQAQYAVMFRYDHSLDKLILLASRELAAPPKAERVVDTLRQTAYQAAATGTLQIVEDMSPDEGEPLALLAVPIKHGSRTREVLCLVFTEQQRFQARDLNTLSLLAIQAAGHLENATLHEKIREGNDRMRAILDSTRDGVILLDQEGRLAEVNPSAERLLGVNLSEHLGEYYAAVLLQAADDQGSAGYSPAELRQLVQSRWMLQEHITRRQFARPTSATQTLHIAETSSPVMDKDNHVAGRLLTLRDVTEEKLLEEYRASVTNMIIHNLRSPMALVQTIIQQTQSTIPNLQQTYPVIAGLLDKAVDNTSGLLEMVNSLMDIARLEARQLPMNFREMAVSDLLREALRTMLPVAQKNNITLELALPPELPPVRVDDQQMHRVLINLLDNALRFTPSGGMAQLSAAHEQNRVVIRVADSGRGIPENEREHIFEKYRQVKDSVPLRGNKGTGLGLTFCKLVVEAHGQTIWLEPQGPLPGACFAFTLPLV